jgi:RNA polymerase sigma-70 factor (ECF subfamily)
MQETFAAVTKALPNFDHDRSGATFRGWLWTITRNKLRDRAGDAEAKAIGGSSAQMQMQQMPDSKVPFLDHLDGDDPPSQIESDTASVRRRAIELLRESFDRRSWRMFWETTIEGRDPSDVADEMGVSRWAVYKARARVLKRLQTEMHGLE